MESGLALSTSYRSFFFFFFFPIFSLVGWLFLEALGIAKGLDALRLEWMSCTVWIRRMVGCFHLVPSLAL